MAEPPQDPSSDSGNNGPTVRVPDGSRPPARPRWVYAFWTVVILFVIVFITLHLTGRGFGPHMHG